MKERQAWKFYIVDILVNISSISNGLFHTGFSFHFSITPETILVSMLLFLLFSSLCILTGKSLPLSLVTQGFQYMTAGVCVLWQICSDRDCWDMTGDTSGSIWGYNHVDREVMRTTSPWHHGGPTQCQHRSGLQCDWWWIFDPSVRASLFMEWCRYVDLIVSGFLLKLEIICQKVWKYGCFSLQASHLI